MHTIFFRLPRLFLDVCLIMSYNIWLEPAPRDSPDLLATQNDRFNPRVVKANSNFETFKSTADECSFTQSCCSQSEKKEAVSPRPSNDKRRNSIIQDHF